MEALVKRHQLEEDNPTNHAGMTTTSLQNYGSKLTLVNVFLVTAGMILLGRSLDGPWVNWGPMIKEFPLDVLDKVWNNDYYKRFAIPWEYLASSMTPTCWNLLLFVSIWGWYGIDKWFKDKNALAMTDIAHHTAELAQKNDSLQMRL